VTDKTDGWTLSLLIALSLLECGTELNLTMQTVIAHPKQT